jgi:transposase
VKRERLEWLAANPRYTRRFVLAVGRRCRTATLKDVADEMDLHWTTVKDIDKLYMQEQLDQAGPPDPVAIGIDEISIGPGHSYRIVVSDLLRKRALWFGGTDRSEESMDLFYHSLPQEKREKIRLAVMDMWKAFRNSTARLAPHARIVYDKFHILKHLGEALDKVRKSEYARLQGEDRRFIKGQKYTLLTNRENLSQEGCASLALLFKANRRLNKAYLLKEQFGQLWNYDQPVEALAFFEKWQSALRWQRLAPYRKFAAMIERHWDGIVSYCQVENKVPLGFVEGFNNKVRALQRRAYGFQDEEYLRLKILTCMLPKL